MSIADILDVILNLAVYAVTVALVARCFRKDGKWAPGEARKAFRFFTVQSNTLCAVTCLLTAACRYAGFLPEWVWILKYAGTAAVAVTMLTVLLFLRPAAGPDWYDMLLKGPGNLFMHLLTPILALFTFCVLEKRGMTFPQCLFGLLPVALYGPLYLYKIIYAPEEKRWDDFYGFNKEGKWPASFAGMLAGTFLLCLALMLLQNL